MDVGFLPYLYTHLDAFKGALTFVGLLALRIKILIECTNAQISTLLVHVFL